MLPGPQHEEGWRIEWGLLGPFGRGCCPGPQHPEACLGKAGVHYAAFPPNVEKQRGRQGRVPDSKGINSVHAYRKHTHILCSSQPGWEEFLLERTWPFSCLSVEGTSPGPFHWPPVTERVSGVGT